MSILRRLKLTALRSAEHLGVFSAVSESRWRQERLLVLCYHGVSLQDEHEWSEAHVSEDHLRRRFEILQDRRYSVLSLSDAFERLSHNDLPPGSVAITFDDGLYDFYAKGQKLLYEFGYPATLYVPTYYTTFGRPVFDLTCAYFLWKGRGREVSLGNLLSQPVSLRIPLDSERRTALHLSIRSHVNSAGYSAAEKDAMLSELSHQVDVDWEAFLESRMLQLMSPKELATLNRQYVDVQLHTHRHRTPRDDVLFTRELDDNIAALESMGFPREGRRHFCYPSGDADPQFYSPLRARGITTATTCEPQIATRRTHPLNVPRVVDTMAMTETEFRGWLSGVTSLLVRRWKTAESDW